MLVAVIRKRRCARLSTCGHSLREVQPTVSKSVTDCACFLRCEFCDAIVFKEKLVRGRRSRLLWHFLSPRLTRYKVEQGSSDEVTNARKQ